MLRRTEKLWNVKTEKAVERYRGRGDINKYRPGQVNKYFDPTYQIQKGLSVILIKATGIVNYFVLIPGNNLILSWSPTGNKKPYFKNTVGFF